jgi:hypothetical protein
MSDRFDVRWKRLVGAARRAPASEPRPKHPAWVEQVARRALLAGTTANVRAREPLAWAGLVSLATAAAIAVLVWPGPIASAADALVSGADALPRAVPHAPRLPRAPVAPRPPLPSRKDVLAAVEPLPELGLDLPFLSRRTVTP